MAENAPEVKSRVDPGEKMKKGSAEDCSRGPVKNRGCTDILCLIIFLAHWVVFWYVAGLGFDKGDARKVVFPTDSFGRVCGLSNDQIPEVAVGNFSINLENHDKLAYTMNLTEFFAPLVENLICASNAPVSAIASAISANCGAGTWCYKNWVKGCSTLSAGSEINITSFVEDPVGEMATFLEGSSSESPLSKFSRYLINPCVTDCEAVNAFNTSNSTRQWDLQFPPDILWAEAWSEVIKVKATLSHLSAINDLLSKLELKAFSTAVCPYPTEYCVPFPGASVKSVAGRCVMSLSALEGAAEALMNNGIANAVGDALGDGFGQMGRTWYLFLIVGLLIIIIGVIFLVILRFTVGCFVWSSIVITFLAFVVAGAYALWLGKFACEGDTVGSLVQSAGNITHLQFGTTNETCSGLFKIPNPDLRNTYFGLSIVAFVVALLYLLIVVCSCKRIRLAIGINKIAARFVYGNKKVIFVPILQIVVAFVWWALWIICALYAISNTTKRYEKMNEGGPFTWCEAHGADYGSGCGVEKIVGKCTGVWPAAPVWKDVSIPGCTCAGIDCTTGNLPCYRCSQPRFDMEPPDGWPFWYLLFSLLWNNAVLVAIGQMTIAGAVGVWYWKGTSPVSTGLKNCFRYHLGSIAFGSFILAIVQLVKWWLRYLQKQMEAQKQNFLAKVAKALAYCVWCFERFIKFLNKNAYIRIALNGENFCRAAWRAFQLIIRNMGRYAVLGGLGAIISRLGTLFIAVAGATIGYFIFLGVYPEENPWLCVAVYLIMGYIGGCLIMNVFGLAVDSVLVCFITDEELNGDAEHAPEELKEFYKSKPTTGE